MAKRLLDAYCGAGGCTKGYQEAGFEVVGVDNKPQKRYCGDDFILGDALEVLERYGHDFDAVHASPPCQFATSLKSIHRGRSDYEERHPNLIPATRDLLLAIGRPYIIENVMGAKSYLRDPIMLCGTFFGLKVYRHRLFETSFAVPQLSHVPHRDHTPSAGRDVSPKGFISVGGGGITKLGRPPGDGSFISVVGHFSGVEYARMAMGIPWMTQSELAQAIPPAYTRYIGEHLMRYLSRPLFSRFVADFHRRKVYG